MSFLTAASERSSSGSGVSGVSDASFSGVSSFSFSFCAVLALLAIRPLLETAPPGGRRSPHHPYPMRRTPTADLEARALAPPPFNPPHSDPPTLPKAPSAPLNPPFH